MLQAPVDYSINAANPMETGLAGFAMGQQMRSNEQGMRGEEQRQMLQAQEGARAETQFGQQNILFDQAQQDRLRAQEEALDAAEKEEALARQTLADKGALVELVRSGKAGAADFLEFSAKYPDIAEELKAPFDAYTAEQKKATVFDLRRAGMALKTGKPEIAIQMLEDRAVAAENSGDPEQADMARATIEMLKTDPAAGQAFLGLILQSVDEEAFKADYGSGADGGDRFKVVGDQLVDLQAPGGPKPVEGVGATDRGAEWVDLTPEELVKYGFVFGQRNTKTGKVEGDKPPKGQTITLGADGSLIITDGVPAGGAAGGLGETVTGTESMVSAIDEIMNDPNLSTVTGVVMGGGGNDVDEFGMARRVAYGSEGVALVEKIGQLQNTTFLAARQMLKGGGAITDFESKKAESAMGRLSRAKAEPEFKAALQDLKDAILEGERKLKAAGVTPSVGDSGSAASPAQSQTADPDIDALVQEGLGLP